MKLILASQSPRRRELLELMGLSFTVAPSDAPEEMPTGTPPDSFVMELSRRKALDLAGNNPDAYVIGSDTIVYHDGIIIGKPKDAADADRILHLLNGRTHTVYTGVTICHGENIITSFDKTEVTFCEMTDQEISAYIASGDPLDKAGSYGIQGPFCSHVKGINGSYFTVIGLPVHLVYDMLKSLHYYE